MGRIGMSQGELRSVEVLARVKSKELKVGMQRAWWEQVTGRRSDCGSGIARKGPKR
jgi:hypothetical protein